MKKYTLLGHIFELEPRAHDYLASYVARIDTYAQDNNIAPDILEDIKYNIIEKLYSVSSPITEAFVMNIAQTIGEPEAIFENRTETDEEISQPKNLIERWFGNNKPMVRGVAYWISQSLKIPVSIVRLILIGSVFIYGTSLWIYPLLALFVPFQDKKATTGQTGNLFFEIIRVLIRLGVIFFLGSALFGGLLGITIFSFLPTMSNQSLQAFVPSFIYPLAILSLISGIILVIGAIGALLKKTRVSKTVVIISSAIIMGSIVTAGVTGLVTLRTYNSNAETIDRQIIATGDIAGDTIVINLHNDGTKVNNNNYLPDFLGGEDRGVGIVQDINLLPSDDNQVKIEIVDKTNIVPQDETENRLAQRSSVTTLISGNTIDITIPDNIFAQEVPFSFAQRSVNISIPKDKKIIYNNNSALSYSTPRTWFETQEGKEYKLYCEDTLSFIYHTGSDSWRCGNTSQSEVNKNNTNLSDWDGRSPEDYSDEALERMFLGISLEQAQVIADSKDRTLRITQQDGLELPSDNDYVPGRLNLEITQGLITDVEIE